MDESLGSLLSVHCLTQPWPKGSKNSGMELSSSCSNFAFMPGNQAQVFLWYLAGVVTLQVFSSASLSISQSFWLERVSFCWGIFAFSHWHFQVASFFSNNSGYNEAPGKPKALTTMGSWSWESHLINRAFSPFFRVFSWFYFFVYTYINIQNFYLCLE